MHDPVVLLQCQIDETGEMDECCPAGEGLRDFFSAGLNTIKKTFV
ncbi:hypothetical protein [Teredinibacter purpureus]|nr:hypothetical protein [Teredinibacter purpureus]